MRIQETILDFVIFMNFMGFMKTIQSIPLWSLSFKLSECSFIWSKKKMNWEKKVWLFLIKFRKMFNTKSKKKFMIFRISAEALLSYHVYWFICSSSWEWALTVEWKQIVWNIWYPQRSSLFSKSAVGKQMPR